MKTGIILMIISALSAATGQLCIKLFAIHGALYIALVAICLYGVGALLMMLAYKLGPLSILHPIQSLGILLSYVYGVFILSEDISISNVIGCCLIISGIIFITKPKIKDTIK